MKTENEIEKKLEEVTEKYRHTIREEDGSLEFFQLQTQINVLKWVLEDSEEEIDRRAWKLWCQYHQITDNELPDKRYCE